MPEYMLTFTAIFATAINLILPFEIASPATVAIAKAIGLPSSIVRFMTINYLPSIGEAMKGKDITSSQKVDIGKKFVGVLIKLGWAFVW
jgi:hypothetical protein